MSGSESMIEMDDGTFIRTWSTGSSNSGRLPVVMMHGGPGVSDYLEPVAELIDDVCLVHRYDQRGTGGSPWTGDHTIARHLSDLATLLDSWGYDRAVVLGHSFGTNLADYFLLAHPERVAGLVHVAGPFLDPWRDLYGAAQRTRRSSVQQERLDELDAVELRTDAEEIEFLALSWFTDHADPERSWEWALAAARRQRPINYVMNSQLNAAKRVEPLEVRLDELRGLMPPGSMIIGGAGDSRPAEALLRHGEQVECEVVILDGAGHDPWLEQPERFGTVLRDAVLRQVAR